MRKIRLPFIAMAVAALLLSTTACKNPVIEMTWDELSGSGTYHSLDNTSTVKLFGKVELNIPNVVTEPLWGQITYWEYAVSEGANIVLYINSVNSYEVLGDYTLDKSEGGTDFLWIGIETVIPRTCDIYNGANPDTVWLTLEIYDNNNNYYSISGSAPFQLTRD
jgi:hypothetical protein